MALGRFGGASRSEDVAALIGKKNYSKAIEVIRDQLKTIHDHLANADPDVRPFLRFFTLTHLHNNPKVSAEDLRFGCGIGFAGVHCELMRWLYHGAGGWHEVFRVRWPSWQAPEIRNPKAEGRRKAEIRNPKTAWLVGLPAWWGRVGFGDRISEFLRPAAFGSRI